MDVKEYLRGIMLVNDMGPLYDVATLFDLPDIVLEKIFLFLTYDEIAKKRLVCRRFNRICSKLLNNGFFLAEKYHSRCLKAIKSQLPRRESERRCHPLSKHCDILTGIETRMSMLSMTFMKYIVVGRCCFIPGKVIDEILRILRYMENYTSGAPPKTLETLQELRDISSMAMEHFDEKIVPFMRRQQESGCSGYSLAGPSRRIENFQRHFMSVRSHEKQNFDVLTALNQRLKKSNGRITKQAKMLQEQNAKLATQDALINELKCHLEEWDHKLRELEAKVNRAKENTTVISGSSEEIFVTKDCPAKRSCTEISSSSSSCHEDKLMIKRPKLEEPVE